MYQKTNDVLGTVNRGNPCESTVCTLCRADCAGKCETLKSSLLGRKLLYPRDFGAVTAGSSNINHIGASYNNLRICLLTDKIHQTLQEPILLSS